ncbi:glyoxylase-like metal-dependent hydrolase (beta-lactamase superfamily II) [Saccharopolyspora erythraea NRRL 2338]|uniref:Metallo-beta-lactamase n=2 Tax=Saccharopolyspora erythraea TaxID=1836 RepID=A4F9E5_SACEN|nr:MBL fold metallo-hydrolase [Saccharopolyspora erythraea]EQD87382.1 beta-lactamase [Saccharopolyspora erythraea D]PFG94458.1 glyoxylase-like metal-dependent hydrolase (beta-lactamase superfamily II) [Saccharopolyspora erythraea NRRL 2338]QRK91214.1 MBL fold metallo-hydrolase [Saccharopolyspora erythraea]CAM00670.1 metallo-beta-lactamase [Saccharopolyspora erythraea NRRL 2338]
MTRWQEVGDGVLVRRYAELDLTVGLVVGSELALVVDTRGDHRQGAELAEAVRQVTPLPWQVVLTHAHFDHCFGTGAFLPAPVWAHERCARHLDRTGESQRAEWIAHYREQGREDIADALAETTITGPDHLVADAAEIDLGGRTTRLLHLGPGHTDHDLVIAAGDVVFAGDLVEQGAPPDFGDAHPRHWPSTLDALLALTPATVVPGHGEPVDPDFVRRQRAEIAEVARLCLQMREGAVGEREAVALSPYPPATTLSAFARVVP